MYIQKSVPLAPYTSFKIGGPADFFCEIHSKKDLADCFKQIKLRKIPFFCLGNGSNLLVSDQGFRGMALKFHNNKIVWRKNLSFAGSGVMLPKLINEARTLSWGGLEWACGIPATLGGAVRNNVGAFGSEMAKSVISIEVFDAKKLKFFTLLNKDCGFSYHKSVFHKNPHWIIWQIALNWKEKPPQSINNEIEFYLKQRTSKQPLQYPSAGSFFRNPSLKNLKKTKRAVVIENFIKKELKKAGKDSDKKELEKKIRDNIKKSNSLPAGYFIESAGLKGKKIGGAEVSKKHANFIINTDNAKAEEVVMLASIIKQKVRQRFGVLLREEVEYVGF